MPEKIRINVTAHTYSIIEKDAESFEFFKSDGRTLNKNALLTNLIVNYHETYRKKLLMLYEYLENEISGGSNVPKRDVSELCYRIAGHINKLEAAPNQEKFDCALGLKPTKLSAPVIDYIEEYMLGGSALSEYFRNMFASYAALPQDERETIIFAPQYAALMHALKHGKKIFLNTKSPHNNSYEADPYAVSSSKEELHCYLLAGIKGGGCAPVRLSRIISVTELSDNARFSEAQLHVLEKMLKYGPQFIYGQNEGETLVQLTARGMEKFTKMYVHRPVPDRIENNNYYFNCSYSQIISYFERFGKDAYVVYPEKVRSEIIRFHTEARNRYVKN